MTSRESAGQKVRGPFDLLVRNTSEVLRVDGSPTDRPEAALGIIPHGAIGVREGRIAFLGPESELPPEARGPRTEVVDAEGCFVGPGFVDPHTHLVFAGERSAEFDLRCQGKGYLEIAAAGGGIAGTVRDTRTASEEALVALALPRLERLLAEGITCVEVKSGYGLSTKDELKMLRVVRRLAELQPVKLVPTLLCAHAVPKEFDSADRWIDECIAEILPQVASERLAVFCDAFAEKGAFTSEQSRRMLEAGKALGLIPRLHADQLTASGASELAAELGAASADHLEQVTPSGIAALATAGTVAVLMPTATLMARAHPYAPGRRLRDAGVTVALATNVNPGTAMSESLALTLGLACLENGLTPAEAYFAATRGAALALRRDSAGRLRLGGPADLVIFSCASYRHLPYHLAIPHIRQVRIDGRKVWERTSALCPGEPNAT